MGGGNGGLRKFENRRCGEQVVGEAFRSVYRKREFRGFDANYYSLWGEDLYLGIF